MGIFSDFFNWLIDLSYRAFLGEFFSRSDDNDDSDTDLSTDHDTDANDTNQEDNRVERGDLEGDHDTNEDKNNAEFGQADIPAANQNTTTTGNTIIDDEGGIWGLYLSNIVNNNQFDSPESFGY